MSIDASELQALRRAVKAAPDDIELRLRLIRVLLEGGQPQGAWHQCIRILSRDEEQLEALELAEKAALVCGAPDRAARYAAKLVAVRSAMPAGPGEKKYTIRGVPLRLIPGGREDSGERPRPDFAKRRKRQPPSRSD